MSNRNSNFPSNQLNNLESGVATQIISNLEMMRKPRVETDEEFDLRITEYLTTCADNDIRVGVEGLCLYCGITRTTLWNWCNGIKCSKHRQESAQMAKQVISTFLEQLNLSGKLNPASAIFYLKNWCGYVDSIDINATRGQETKHELETVEEIQSRYTEMYHCNNEPPKADF